MKASKWMMPLVFTLVMVAMIWLALSDQTPRLLGAESRDDTRWDTGWRVEADGVQTRALTLPLRLTGGENAISNTLPDPVHTNYFLYIKTDGQRLHAEVNGQPVAVEGLQSQNGSSFPCEAAWTRLPIAQAMAGQTIRLYFDGGGTKPCIEVYSLHAGTETRVQLTLLRATLPTTALSVLTALFALALYAFATLEARRHGQSLGKGYRYLILFVFISSMWFYLESDVGAVSYLGSTGYQLLAMASLFFIPFPLLLFCQSLGKVFRRASRAAMAGYGAVLAAACVSWAAGVFLLWVACLCLQALSILYACVTLYLAFRHRRTFQKNEALGTGLILISSAGLANLLAIALFPLPDNAVILRFGMLALLVTLTVTVLRPNLDALLMAQNMELLRVREEEYRIAVRQSNKHVTRFDVAESTLSQGEDPAPLFGKKQVIAGMPEAALESGLVARESQADFRAFFEAMLAGKPEGNTVISLRGETGEFVWYRADFTMIYADDRRPLQAIVTFSDITEQRERELAYQKWKQSYAEMPAHSMNYYEYNLSRDAFVAEAGQMLPPLTAQARQSLSAAVDTLADSYVLPADDHLLREFFRRDRLLAAYAHGVRSDRLEFRRMAANGQPLWTQASVQLIADPYGSDIQGFLLLKDIDAQKRDDLLVRERSTLDPLTGLLNRAAFEEQISALFQKTDADTVHALLMIDVDGFKRVNDTYGHHFGDRVLIDIADNLRAMMRGDDLIGRIGGDEYMVCLRNVREGTGFLERRSSFICQSLGKQYGTDVAISGSVGLALFPHDGHTFDELYQKADKALYYAKHHGKNRYVFYNEDLLRGDANTPSAQSLLSPPADREEVAQAQREPVRTLLIADDVEMNRELLGEIFRGEYNLLFAENGRQCLELMQRNEAPVAAMLLDLIMPGMGGLQVLEHIQKDVYLASIPVIVTSAADETEFSLRAIELGATDFVSKPVDPRLVKLRVKNAVRKRETDELRAQNRYLLVQKSDESRHQDELRYLAEHDPLTNISNKATFYRDTQQMLQKNPGVQFMMAAFDIEKFRVINDIFGHEEGDRLLRYIAQRMQALYAGSATFGRTDADNFAICLPYEREALRRRFAANEAEMREYDLAFEIVLVYGLYIIDDRTLPVSIMLDRAEMAKRTIKGNYVQRFAYYDDALRRALLDELELVNNMDSALQGGQFEVYLQPKCRLADGGIVGAEALVRWNHPTRGVLTPGAFVPIFERNGFIMKLDAWVWEQVCRLLRKWMDQNSQQPYLPVSMNVSRVNIYNPSLIGTLTNLAERYEVPRRMLELEITESAYADDPKQLSGRIAELRSRGFIVQMDDFGSAYSSLNMLKEISVDLLKLDMHFLYGSDREGRGGTILSSIVRMARYLSLPIVAEGVENAEQARFLYSIGCAVAQGYYFYRPMSIPDFERLLQQAPALPQQDAFGPYPESAVRRVWGIDGDFSLMLSTIPCAASLCEMTGEHIEILRINDAYLALTGDSMERIYRDGTDARNLTTPENYRQLIALFHDTLGKREPREALYNRLAENGSMHRYRVRITFLTGDLSRALFFITYTKCEEGCGA